MRRWKVANLVAIVILAGGLALPAGGMERAGVPLRGDVNGDGTLNVGDVFHLINGLFAGGPPAATPCAGDADASGSIDVGDVFFLINYLFAGGLVPGNPVATVTAPPSACMQTPGLVASVPAQTGAAYAWTVNPGAITAGAGTSEITWSAGAPGLATVACTVTVADCAATGSAPVTIDGPVITSLAADPAVIELGTSSTLSFTIADATSWALGSSLGNGLDPSSGAGSGTFAVTYTASGVSGLDTITLTVTNGCGSTQQTVQIQVGGGDEITIYLGPGNTVPLVLVKIPAGTFQMGAPAAERGSFDWEKPQHEVTLSQAFYLGKTEVTQGQWVAVMGVNPAHDYGVGDDYPVYYVSWNDICGGTTGSSCTATSFIGKVNVLLGTTKFRLPTEAEWERGARGGTTTEFSFAVPPNWDLQCGSFSEATSYMWWCGNNTPYWTKPVGTKQANPYELYDMHGNVYEWVGDWWGSYTAGAVTDPPGPTTGSYRVCRGGGWTFYARHCRSAARNSNDPVYRGEGIGFRLARSL